MNSADVVMILANRYHLFALRLARISNYRPGELRANYIAEFSHHRTAQQLHILV
mgnify:CR=1 FL=1